MPHEIDQTEHQLEEEFEELEWLGSRHDYQQATPRSMAQMARRIGFSADEISELKRIYRGEFDETQKFGKLLRDQ